MTFQQRAALINAGRLALWTTIFGVPDSWYRLPAGLETEIVLLPLADTFLYYSRILQSISVNWLLMEWQS